MTNQQATQPRLFRVNQLAALLGLSRTTIWRWERDGHLPPARTIGSTAKKPMRVWLASDITTWLESAPLAKEATE